MGLLTSSASLFSEVSRIHSAGKKPFSTTMPAAITRSACGDKGIMDFSTITASAGIAADAPQVHRGDRERKQEHEHRERRAVADVEVFDRRLVDQHRQGLGR